MAGRMVLIEFWATWCGPCRAQIPTLNDLHDRFGRKGLVVIGVTEEEGSVVSGYVTKLGIRYPICAGGPRTNPTDALPHCILLAGDGSVAAEGTLVEAARVAESTLRDAPESTDSGFASEGRAAGWVDPRPPGAAEHDAAALESTLQAMFRHPGGVQARDLPDLFAFYWKNFPLDGWPGDAALRFSACQAVMRVVARDTGAPSTSVRADVRRELLARLRARDPAADNRGWIAKYVAAACDVRDEEAIDALQSAKEHETHPLVEMAIAEALEALGDASHQSPIVGSPLDEAKRRYDAAMDTLKAKLLGAPSEFRAYHDYKHGLEALFASGSVQSCLSTVSKDFERHASTSSSDLLIRSEILDHLTPLRIARTLTVAELEALQRTVFHWLNAAPDGDWRLRQKILWAQNGVGLEHLDRSLVLARLDELIAQEKIRRVRAYLEYMRFKVQSGHEPD